MHLTHSAHTVIGYEYFKQMQNHIKHRDHDTELYSSFLNMLAYWVGTVNVAMNKLTIKNLNKSHNGKWK